MARSILLGFYALIVFSLIACSSKNSSSRDLASEAGGSAPSIVNNEPLVVGSGTKSNLSDSYVKSDLAVSSASIIYTLTAEPNNGNMLLNGVSIVVGATFTQADIDNGLLSYQHDGSSTTTDTVTFTVGAESGAKTEVKFSIVIGITNTAPTISDISNQTISVNGNTGSLPLTVNDSDNNLNCANVSVSSSNVVLIPTANIVIGGTLPNCTVTATPVSGQTGSAAITLTISDGALSAQDTFSLTVDPLNTAPTISNIANQEVDKNLSTTAIPFTISDSEDTLSCATHVSTSSSDVTLLPNANIVIAGTAPNCTMTLTPATGQTGSVTVTTTLSDGTLSDQDTFQLTVLNQVSWYVRKTGNDSNNCLSAATACLTIQGAHDKADDDASGENDVIYVGAGVYNESVVLAVSGSSDTERFQFIADTTGVRTGDAGTVAIDGTGLATSDEAFDVGSYDYVTIEGFLIQNFTGSTYAVKFSTGATNGIARKLTFINVRMYNLLLGGNNHSADDIEVHNFGSTIAHAAVYVSSGTGHTVTNVLIKGNGLGRGLYMKGRATWSNIKIYDVYRGIYIHSNANQNTFNNIQIYSPIESGIYVSSSAAKTSLFKNVLIANSFGSGIIELAGGSANVYENITIYGSASHGFDATTPLFATVKNSIIANSGGTGFYCSGSCASLTHINNIFWNNTTANITGVALHGSEMQADPLFITAGSNFKYQQLATLHGSDSPAVDAGSDTAANLGLDDLVTRTDGVTDSGTVDLGYHYPAGNVAPIGLADSFEPFKNTPFVMNKATQLLNNDLELESQTLSITGFDAKTVNGGTITDGGTTLTYTAPTNFIGKDYFRYTVSDGTDTDSVLVSLHVVDVQTYFVRTAGNNTNNCTAAGTACATIAGVIAKLPTNASGDVEYSGKTIYVGGGTYTSGGSDEIVVNKDSNPNYPIRIIADVSGVQTGDAGAVIIDANGDVQAFYLTGDYVVIDGFTIKGYGTYGVRATSSDNSTLQNLIIEGPGGNVGTGVQIQSSVSVTLKNALIYNNGIGLNFTSVTNSAISNITIDNNGNNSSFYLDSSSSGNTLTHSIITNGASHGIYGPATAFASHTYNLIWNNAGGNYMAGVSADGTELSTDPLFVNAGAGDYHLQHTAAGQGADSPAIDAGSGTSASLGMDTKSTRTDAANDSSTVDLGFHY